MSSEAQTTHMVPWTLLKSSEFRHLPFSVSFSGHRLESTSVWRGPGLTGGAVAPTHLRAPQESCCQSSLVPLPPTSERPSCNLGGLLGDIITVEDLCGELACDACPLTALCEDLARAWGGVAHLPSPGTWRASHQGPPRSRGAAAAPPCRGRRPSNLQRRSDLGG